MARRRLTHEEHDLALDTLLRSAIAPTSLLREAVGAAEIVPFQGQLLLQGVRPIIAFGALHSTARGITLGQEIYLRQDVFAPDGTIPAYLLVHEVAHVVQYLRDGTSRFLTRYLSEYFQGLLKLQSGREAYLAISYEVEARQVESHLPRPLQR